MAEREPRDPCEHRCETVCEHNCQMACEQDCQSPCQLGCQTAEQRCQSGCQSTCQTSCQVSCQAGCEVSDQSDLSAVSTDLSALAEAMAAVPRTRVIRNVSCERCGHTVTHDDAAGVLPAQWGRDGNGNPLCPAHRVSAARSWMNRLRRIDEVVGLPPSLPGLDPAEAELEVAKRKEAELRERIAKLEARVGKVKGDTDKLIETRPRRRIRVKKDGKKKKGKTKT